MAAKIGILGESTAVSVATVTTYTVPADKAARVRVLIEMEGPANVVNFSVRMGTPSNQATFHKTTATNNDIVSGVYYIGSPDPALTFNVAYMGAYEAVGLLYLSDADNSGFDIWAAPLPADYFLSTGDTVRFRIAGNAADDLLFQVQGVEDDA